MGDNEFLLQEYANDRLRQARERAARRAACADAALPRSSRPSWGCGPGTAGTSTTRRPPRHRRAIAPAVLASVARGFAIAAEIVENTGSRLIDVYRRASLEG